MEGFKNHGLSNDDVITAQTLYWEQLGIEDPSPSLVRDFLAGLEAQGPIRPLIGSPDGFVDFANEGYAFEEEYEVGVNDFMSGALSERDRARPTPLRVRNVRIAETGDNTTVCERVFDQLSTRFPYYIVDREGLANSDAFRDGEIAYELHEDFHITIRGIHQAQDEACRNAVSENPEDELILAAMLRRGGIPRKDAGWILYPEDLEPIIGPEDGGLYEKRYWDDIKALKLFGLEEEEADVDMEIAEEQGANTNGSTASAEKDNGKQKEQ